MLGAIAGDIIGSVYERNNIKTKDFPLFCSNSIFTDDTVMTVATADAIINGATSDDFINSYYRFGMLYPHVGYGYRFKQWLISKNKKPYNSYGNGSAMRVSPCAWCFSLDSFKQNIKKVEKLAEISASVSHNHPEGIKGAVATAFSVYFMRYANAIGKIDEYKTILKKEIENRFGYNLNLSLDEIREKYTFNVSCQGSVPEAIIAFLESNSFEDAIRCAISIGGDSDTIADITGAIAEAAYNGVPENIKNKSLCILDDDLKKVIYRFQSQYQLE